MYLQYPINGITDFSQNALEENNNINYNILRCPTYYFIIIGYYNIIFIWVTIAT